MIMIHIINILFFVFLGFLTVGFFAAMAPSEIPPLNPIIIGTLVFLWSSLIVNYIVQIKNRHSWWVIILGNVLFSAIVLFVLLVVLPTLRRIVY